MENRQVRWEQKDQVKVDGGVDQGIVTEKRSDSGYILRVERA